MAKLVSCLNLFLVVLALCTLQGDATYYNTRRVDVSFKQSEYLVRESDGKVAITIQAARRYYYSSFYVKIRARVNKHLRPYASSYDFEESIQTVKFSSRQSTATCYIKINDDDLVESTEIFEVDILIPHNLHSRGVRFGSPYKAKVYIKDDDKVKVTQPPTTRPPDYKVKVSFKQSEYSVVESAGRVAITIQAARRYYTSFYVKIRASVNKNLRPYASSHDFEESIQTVKFSSRQSTATCYIKINDDDLVESTEAFQVEILIPRTLYSQGIKFGSPSKAIVLIKDDDKVIVTKPPATRPPVNSICVQFSQGQYIFDESAGYALLKVTVSGHRAHPVSVNAKVFVVSSSFKPKAASTRDVDTGERKLIFNTGVNVIYLKVRIYDDKLLEGTEAFGAQLFVPDHHRSSGLKLCNPSHVTVFIKDDEKPATRPPTKPPTTRPSLPGMSVKVAFEFGRYVVQESCTLLSVTLKVFGEVIQPFTVGVRPVGFHRVTAIPGRDFESDSLEVDFQPGQSSANVCIVIIDDDLTEGSEKFRLLLSIPYSTRSLGVWAKHPYYADVIITDDPDDGMGLPVQLPPTDDERATMCICKPRPDPFAFSVMFNDSSFSGDEADGVIAVTVVATGVSSTPYNVTITPSELDPVSARELFDYSNDTIVVTFNPGETNKTVLIVVNPDCGREGSEFFNLTLSLDSDATDLGITLGDPSEATVEIRDTDIIFVNFSRATYSAEEADGAMIITLEADGFSPWPYAVEITPTEILPVGAPGNAEGNGTDFQSDTLIALFDPGDSQVDVLLPITMDFIPEPTETFLLNLTVPDDFSDINGRLLIKPGPNDVAEGEIINSNLVLVNLTADSYRADINVTSVEVSVMAFGSFDTPFIVEVVPDGTDLPEGVNQFFNPDIRQVLFPVGVTTALIPIQLFPEQLGDMDLQFTVTLAVPADAMLQGVVLGEPSVATVTVPVS